MTHDKLGLHQVPLFCGGRILTGFFYWETREFDEFVTCLIKLTGTVPAPGNNGVIYAITNSQQSIAAGFLEKVGFKLAIVTDKFGPLDENGKPCGSYNRVSSSSPCKTWIGDWFKDVQPTLQKLHEEEKAKKAEKVLSGGSLRKSSSPAKPLTSAIGYEFKPGQEFYFISHGPDTTRTYLRDSRSSPDSVEYNGIPSDPAQIMRVTRHQIIPIEDSIPITPVATTPVARASRKKAAS